MNITFMVFVGIICATIARIILGMIWYSPGVFGTSWMKMVGIKDIKPKDGQMAIVGGVITSIIIAAMMSCFITRLGINSIWNGVLLGLSVWFGFVGTSNFGGVLWERRSISWFILTTGYEFIAYGLTGGIIAFFA